MGFLFEFPKFCVRRPRRAESAPRHPVHVILSNFRRPINAGHRMNNPPQSCLFQPQQFPGVCTENQILQ
jgi:hypothetical protein